MDLGCYDNESLLHRTAISDEEEQCTRRVPEEAVDIFEPLRDKVVGDGLCVVGEAQVLQRVEQQRRVIVECSDGHL